VFNEIYGQAMAQKHYLETHDDAVDDYPRAFIDGAADIVAGRMLSVGPNGSGWVDSRYTVARQKLLDLVEACSEDSEGMKILADLRKRIKGSRKYAGGWCLADPEEKGKPDPETDYVFMEYQTEDMVEDQLSDELVEKLQAPMSFENLEHINA